MKRFVHGLLAALLIVGNVAAKTYTDKTFLMPRSHGMNMAMEYTTWHKQMALIDDDKFGGTIQVTGFYEESENKKDLGQYFGTTNWDNNNCIDDFFAVVPQWYLGNDVATPAPHPKHTSAPLIFHTYKYSGPPNVILADKLTWRPYREAYGVRLDYHQKLDKLLKGLFFKVSLPIVHVRTSMGWSSSCCNSSCDPCSSRGYCIKQNLSDSDGELTGTAKSVADYLTGNVTYNSAIDNQVALCKAKIHNGNSETGVGDIDFIFGYNFWYEKEKHVNINVGVTIPTGNEPDGEYLFEATVGNAGHWALGFGLDSSFQLWESDNWSLDFLAAFNYRYLFSSTEKRTMGFVWPGTVVAGTNNDLVDFGWAGKRAIYGHWLLGAKKGDTYVTPMANFLTRDMKVTPGSHFDGIVQLALNCSGWTFDLGYNLFAREADSVSLKGSCCDPCGTSCSTSCGTSCCGWLDDTYAVARDTWETDTAFDHPYLVDGDWINTCHLCLDACTQPSVVTHKIYGGIGYAFNEWEYPLMLGIGGSYEFETDNDSLEAWSLWAKIGLTF